MDRYVVKNTYTGMLLGANYYRDNKEVYYVDNAYKFSSFELVLANKMILKNNKKYKVYLYSRGDKK